MNMIIKDQEEKNENSDQEKLKMSKYLKLDSHQRLLGNTIENEPNQNMSISPKIKDSSYIKKFEF